VRWTCALSKVSTRRFLLMPPNREHDTQALIDRLTALHEQLRAEGRTLESLDIVLARDAVEVLETVMVAIRGHRFDTQHIHEKGVYPHIRLADQMLYEAAGLDRVPEVSSDAP
jgi:hypothetical protein